MGSGNVARNSPSGASSRENRSLELQRFWMCSKNDSEKLRATFVWGGRCGVRVSRRARELRSMSRHWWGFALHEALWPRVVGVSDPHVVQFPPIAGAEAAFGGDVVPKLQTTSVENAGNGPLWGEVDCVLGKTVSVMARAGGLALRWVNARMRGPRAGREPACVECGWA